MSVSDAEIYRAHRVDLVRYASALVGPSDGPDLLSAVVTRVLAKGSLSDLDSPKRYLMRAIGNEAKSYQRQRARQQVLGVNVGDVSSLPGHDLALEAVMGLPVQQRAATYLVYWLGYEPSEAAGVMGCRPGTVRRYLYLARRKLEEVLDAPD